MRLVIDCTTGDAETRELTAEEVAEQGDAAAEADAERRAEANAEANAETLRVRAVQALVANRSFLANQNPTSADVVQQVRLLTRENTALIRLLLRQLDATD